MTFAAWISIAAVVLLAGALLAGWTMTLLGLPGNWLMATSTAIFVVSVPASYAVAIGWPVVAANFALAAVGEVLETTAGAAGTMRAGGSRRAAYAALIGSLVGGLIGVFVGMPLPIVGPLVAAVVLSGCGALAGAVLAELSLGSHPGKSLRVGGAAFVGRVLGTAAKVVIASTIVAVTCAALIFN